MTSADAMAAQENITKKMTEMVDELDRTRLRKIQLQMHRCSVKCCENDAASLEQTQRCIEKCSQGVNNAQEYVQREVGHFQNRLQRCVLDCQDRAKDKLGPNPSELEIEDVKAGFENCAIKCVDSHVSLMPDLLKRMKKFLGSST
ncbi:unnamed protein product [Allacma fusca]|uniref:Protein FAM136A n=1 Tax=Allacma fusca TaxID=39272 RepID=A0A8J2LFK8_9HEXA|nr:unnamed protein product [Allacma fusca]